MTDSASTLTTTSNSHDIPEWLSLCAVIAALLLSCLPYLPALSGQPIWDDHGLLYGVSSKSPQTLAQCFTRPIINTQYFRPVVAISFLMDRKLFSASPFFAHQWNILFHVAATAALMGLLGALFKNRAVAAVGGLLFAVQPAQIMAVAWIGGRTDELCALSVILFLWTLLLAAKSPSKNQTYYLAASIAFFALAVFTREQSALLIFLVPFVFRRLAPPGQSLLIRVVPFALVIAVYAACWLHFNSPAPPAPSGDPLAKLTYPAYTTVYYALLLLAPSVKWLYTFDLGQLQSRAAFIAGWLIVGTSLLACWRFRKTHPEQILLALTAALYLSPVLNFVPVPSLLVAPNRAATAGVAIAGLMAAILAAPGRFRSARLVLAGLFGLYSLGLTAWGARQWNDDIQFCSHVAVNDPSCLVVRYNLASYLWQAKQLPEARQELQAILKRLDRPGTVPRAEVSKMSGVTDNQWKAIIHSRLGDVWLKDNVKIAEEEFDAALALDKSNADANIGKALSEMARKDFLSAKRHLLVAVASNPEMPDPHGLLGDLYLQLGDKTNSEKERLIAAALSPIHVSTGKN